jgi:hypothetical protein
MESYCARAIREQGFEKAIRRPSAGVEVAARQGRPGTRNRVHIVLGRAQHRVPSQPLIGLPFGIGSPELGGPRIQRVGESCA